MAAQSTNGAIAPDAPATVGDLNDSGTDLKAVPLAVNRQVLQWIDNFQGQGRPHMERYLSRSTRYMPLMKKILKEQGLPEDLIYIVLIESGFNGTAKSTASAVGFWQFIRGTGKRYGLRIDTYVELGVERIVVPPARMSRHDESVTLAWLDEWASVMAELA